MYMTRSRSQKRDMQCSMSEIKQTRLQTRLEKDLAVGGAIFPLFVSGVAL